MAYIDQRTAGNQRVAVMTIVAVLQGAAIVALINGLAVTWRKPAPVPNPTATDIPITMPIPIPLPPPKAPIDQKPRVEDPVPQIPRAGPFTDPRPPIPVPVDPVVPWTADPPIPQPTTPAIAPRGPRPRNAPGSWATANDYPSRDLREGNQGVTGFTLTIGADGKVQFCRVTVSSGFPGLDKATCDNVSRRARFDPATDDSGNRVGGTYSNRIRWEIPQG